MQKIPKDKRLQQIEELSKNYNNVKEFYAAHPYLYKWALKHDIDVKPYFPKKPIHCKLDERENKGIDCYKVGTNKLYRHYPFIIDALRDLDLTYYFVHRCLNGTIPSINGYKFIRCV